MADPDYLVRRGLFPPVLTFLLVFLIVYLSRDSRINQPDAIYTSETVILFLHERSDLDTLLNLLDDLSVVVDHKEMRWVSSLLGWRTFSAGRYVLDGGYPYQEFLSKLALGLQDHASVTVPSGASIERLAGSLSRQLRADSSQFAAVFSDTSALVLELELTPDRLFSRMLPDTYNIYWTTPPDRVIRRINSEFNRRIEQRYAEEIEASSLDLDDLVTLASIVEWEAGNHQEKPLISGLYVNRLHRGMRLQADPTVIYALGEHRRLFYEDYQLDHPYNTYRNSGLPPGPITNPDYHSLRAAILPEEHNYLYMVASPEGGHVFTQTFEEHRAASANWRRWLQEQYRIRDQRESGN